MKKNLIISGLVLAFLSLLLFYACGNEKKQNGVDVVEQSILLTELQDFNNELMQTIEPGTRGFWNKVLKVCAVVSADAVGAYEGGKIGGTIGGVVGGVGGAVVGGGIGGLIAGAGASYLAYDQVYGAPSQSYGPGYTPSQIYNDPMLFYRLTYDVTDADMLAYKADMGINIDLPLDYAYVEQIAIKHNIALNRFFSGESMGDINFDTNVYYQMFDTYEFKAQYQRILDNVSASLSEIGQIDMESYIANADDANYSPLTASVLG